MTKSAVHTRAEELGLPVLTPATLKDSDIQREIADFAADAVAVVAYGMRVPPELLRVPKHGWINLHFSLLPAWRGAAPVQYAIAAGDSMTGTSVFQIEEGLDTGPVFDMDKYPIGSSDTADDLLDRLAHTGAGQLSRVLTLVEAGEITAVAQSGEPSYAPRFSSVDTRINWNDDAVTISAQSRGWWPAPGAWTELGTTRVKLGPVAATTQTGLAPGEISAGQRVMVGTGTDAVVLDRVGPAGKPWMAAEDWARGLQSDSMRFEIGKSDE